MYSTVYTIQHVFHNFHNYAFTQSLIAAFLLYSTNQEQVDKHSQLVKFDSRLDSQKFWELRLKLRKIMSLLLDYLSRSKLDEEGPLRYVLLYVQKGNWLSSASSCVMQYIAFSLPFLSSNSATLNPEALTVQLYFGLHQSNYQRTTKALYTERCQLKHLYRRHMNLIHLNTWEMFDWQ